MAEFDIKGLTISKLHSALRNGTTSCSEVVNAYLARIAQYDPTIKALICINPNAKDIAKQKDTEIKSYIQNQTPFPPLCGVPIILKDNYTTIELPTSAGSKALQSLRTKSDSVVVARLRDAGAIILAKANLHEFALHGTTTSSLGGQTLNPYDLSRTPGGSSGGTAAALAANMGLVGCGTDTMNSLRSPASACSIVGFRPSKGLVSKEGIVPVSETQDMAGPMARTVEDVRTLFQVMRVDGSVDPPYSGESKTADELRIGYLGSYYKLEGEISRADPGVVVENCEVCHVAVSSIMDSLDMDVIDIEDHDDWSISRLLQVADTQPFEFRDCLDSFLQSDQISSTPHRSLESIAQSGEYHKEAVTEVFHAPLENPKVFSRTSPEYQSRLDTIAALKESVNACFEKHNLDAILFPHQRQLVVTVGHTRQPNRNGVLAALTGRPAICIPGVYICFETGIENNTDKIQRASASHRNRLHWESLLV